jgi:CheY-like chemotaxis protein
LTFSRKQEIHTKVLDLNELVKSFEKLMKRLIGDNISLQLNLAAEPLWIKADASQLEQVLMNLAINASDSMPEGGSLCIETTTVSPQTHLRKLTPELSQQPAAILTFTDTGSGMSGETIKQIFEPFFTTKGKDKGTGLGLSTCYGIIKQHKGLILVDSEPGKGSVFKVLLPLTEKCAPETQPVTNEKISINRTTKALVMEDDPYVRKLISMIMQNKGFAVTAVENGQQAIETARSAQEPFGLIIADIIMPVINGPKACKEIVKIFPEARILFISGYADNKLEEYGINRERINFLHKPFTRNELINAISLTLDNKENI